MAVTIVAFLVGGLLIFQSWRQKQKVKSSLAWPYVAGRITASSVSRVVDRGDADNADTVSYVPLVQYDFQVGNQIYQGNRLAFHNKGYGSQNKAFRAVAAYAVGSPVWVFFDPANPQNAVLERKAPGNNMFLVIGVILVAAGVASLFTK